MRELKFQIWDKQNKTFVKDPTRYQRLAISCDGRGVYSGKYDDCVKDRYIICQYTGLKDKNGKDIYEGDIVLYRKQNREVCIGEFWDGADDRVGTFLQNPEIKHRNFGTNKLSAFTSCEIIGNIFENPDLLK